MQFDRMRRWTRDLIAIDSVTGREGELAAFLARELPARGWTIRELPVQGTRRNLLASFDTEQPRICFNTHLDTVPEAYGPDEDSERLYGRGACDTKGILAAMLEALEEARRIIASSPTPRPPPAPCLPPAVSSLPLCVSRLQRPALCSPACPACDAHGFTY